MTTPKLERLADLWADATCERGIVAAAIADDELRRSLADQIDITAFSDAGAVAAWEQLLAENFSEAISLAEGWPASLAPHDDLRRVSGLAMARSLADVPRELQTQLNQLAKGTSTPETAAAKLSEISMRAAQHISPTHVLRPATSGIAGVLAEAELRRDHRARTGDAIMGMKTRIASLDKMLGGIQTRRFYVLMAPPNIGKTTLSNQVAYTIAQQGGVSLYVSFENPADDLIRKQLARIAQLSVSDIDNGLSDSRLLADAGLQFRQVVGDRLYYVDGTATTNSAVIRGYVAQLKRIHPHRQLCVFVDYLQKLATRPAGDGIAGYDDLRGNVSRVTQELQDTARQLDCAIVAISSVNRSAYSGKESRANLSSAKESGSIEFDADAVMMLEEFKKDDNDVDVVTSSTDIQPMRLRVEKNRFGAKGPIRLGFNTKQARFAELDFRGSLVDEPVLSTR